MNRTPGYLTEKQAVLTRLRRVEGQRPPTPNANKKLTEASEAIARIVRS